MIWNLIGAALIIYLGHKLADRLKAGQQFAMYLMWYGLGRTWIENVRINYSTVILGLRTNVWTAIIVFVIGCILFIVLYQHGPDSKVQAPATCGGHRRRTRTPEHRRRTTAPEEIPARQYAISNTGKNSVRNSTKHGAPSPIAQIR